MLPPVSLGQGAPASAPAANSKASKPTGGSASFGDIMAGLTAAGGDSGARAAEPSETRVENARRSPDDEEEEDSAEEAAPTRRTRRATPAASVDQMQVPSSTIVGVPSPPVAPAPVHARGTHGTTGDDIADTSNSAQHPLPPEGTGKGAGRLLPAARLGPAITSPAQDSAEKNALGDSLAELLSPMRPSPQATTPSAAGPNTGVGSKHESGAQVTRGAIMANGPPEATGKDSPASNVADRAIFSHGITRETSGGKACTPPEAHLGTPGAQELAQMKKAEKMLKVAASAQQNLPEKGDRTISAAGISSAKEGAPSPVMGNDPVSSGSPLNVGPASTRTEPAISSSADSARLGSLERTHDLVAAHALRLRESGAGNLRVVIQPGDGTHLAIELKHANGRIEAQATLQQGDFDHLNRHWGELQQRLESRKIQLGALQHPGQTFAENSSSSHQHKRSSKEDQAGSYATDFVFGGSMTESPANRNVRKKVNRGWETWA